MMKFVAVLALPAAMAWWDGGHYISGAIARETLLSQKREDAVEWIEKILRLDPDQFGDHSDFYTAPTWMDDIKSRYDAGASNETHLARDAVRTWDDNHFMNIPVEDDCKGDCIKDYKVIDEYLSQKVNNIDILLSGAFTHLAPEGGKREPGNGKLWATQLHLRWLMHLVGDAHMPFHMTGLWHRGLWKCPSPCSANWCSQCRQYPNDPNANPDDRYLERNHHCNGGNYIYVKYDNSTWPSDMDVVSSNNLHGFWDSMGGFAQIRSNAINEKEKLELAKKVMEEYPFEEMSKKFKIWGNNWTLKKDVYPYAFSVAAQGAAEDKDSTGKAFYGFMNVNAKDHLCLSGMGSTYCNAERSHLITEEYRAFAEKASKRLVALAGYRLADALARVVDGLPPRMRVDIDRKLKETCSLSGSPKLFTLGAGLLVSAAFLLSN